MPPATVNYDGDMSGADLVAAPEADAVGGNGGGTTGGAGVAVSAIGAIGSAYASRAAGANNRRIARYNASLARIHAFQATQQAVWQANRIRARTADTISAQRAGYAGQGVVVGSGSAADVATSTEGIGAGDVQQAQMNGIMSAWGYESQAREFTLRGDMDYRTGLMNASGDLTTGATRAAEFEYGMHH